jgi:hypothetical protein
MVGRLGIATLPGQLRANDCRDCFLNEARILNLRIADVSVDLALPRHEHDVSVNVPRRKET